MARIRRNNEVLHFFVPIYETVSHGQEVIVEPTEESAFVWIQGEGITSYKYLEDRVKNGEVKEIQPAGYFYRGRYYLSGTPECEDILVRLENDQELLNRTEQVEVFRVERVIDWMFTVKAAAIASLTLNFLILFNHFILRLGGA